MAKTRVSVGDKVNKLREGRQPFARFLIIQQSRPELVPKLAATSRTMKWPLRHDPFLP